MYKKLYSYVALAIGILVVSCNEDDKHAPYTFTSNVDVSETQIADDQYKMALVFSTDNGTTFVDFPVLSVGQEFMVKVKNSNSGEEITNTAYVLDWSASDPQPSDVNADVATFSLAKGNEIKVKVLDKHCAFDPKLFTGAWKGDEVGTCCSGTDKNNLTQDTSNPNKIVMDNFWGDGVDVYMIFTPSTTIFDQTVTIPTQVTSENGTASGTGTYDQCRETFTIHSTYKIGGSTYVWDYNFHK